MSSPPTLDPRLLTRVRGEYREMPGLSLTLAQACRLWQVDPATCHAVLQRLIAEQFLVQSPTGMYAATASAPKGFPQRRASSMSAA